MATTPNYGWVTPAPTDLVTDLPADFEVFADAVDADLGGLLGGTTGQVLAKTTDSDHDFDWVTPATSPITTEGDLIIGDATGDSIRLPIGAIGTVLTSDGDTADWVTPVSGSLTLISTTALSGATVTLSSIPSTYKALKLVIRNFFPSMNGTRLLLRFNGDANTRYSQVQGFTNLGNATATSLNITGGSLTQTGNTAGQDKTLIECDIPDYSNNVTVKFTRSTFFGNSNSSGGFTGTVSLGGYNQTSVISSIDLLPDQGNFTSGSVLLYGVN